MALPYPIASSQTDAKSPVDDNLMDSIRLDLNYLDGLLAAGNTIMQWNINGRISKLSTFKRAIDSGALYGSFTPNFVRAALKKSGTSGTLQYDIRKVTTPKTPITAISHQYSAATSSIANVAPALATQSIARNTAQIATQSITHAKAAANVQSIINISGTLWRYNLDVALDSDTVVGDSFVAAGCTAGGNNGTFTIVEISQSGYPSVVVNNASGVAQTGAVGTVQVKIMSYNYANPVSSEFAAGEIATMATHTTGANNGSLTIFKINQGGNNIWIKNSTGATQAGVAGTADSNRWKYTYLSAPSVTDFIVGEKAKMASHTTGANNGNFTITSVGATTIVVYNSAGVVQGGVAGTANTNRWIYSLPTDPSAQVTAGDTISMEGHTNALNNGIFTVKQVNRGSVNNIVIYNESGVVQAGTTGNTITTRKLIQFASDQSAVYTTSSFVEITGCPDGQYNFSSGKAPKQVLQVNRGGGSNFNIVVDMNTLAAASQSSPAGYVIAEMKSICGGTISLAVDVTGINPNQYLVQSTTIAPGSISAGQFLGLFILGVPSGVPEDLTVTLH